MAKLSIINQFIKSDQDYRLRNHAHIFIDIQSSEFDVFTKNIVTNKIKELAF
jgi:hypothetical protein